VDIVSARNCIRIMDVERALAQEEIQIYVREAYTILSMGTCVLA
jgi:hypothetical protein